MIKTVCFSKPLKGSITIPADKSISHRAVMLSSLAHGKSLIKNFSSGADCHSTLKLFNQLGIKSEFIDEKTLIIEGGKLSPRTSSPRGSGFSVGHKPVRWRPDVTPPTSRIIQDRAGVGASSLSCGNSGTTIRLVSGILAGQTFDSILTGDESLSKRPMMRIIKPLTLMGANITSVDGHAPLTIRGQKLHGIEYTSPIASAQVKSAVLLAGLHAEGKTIFTEPSLSRDHTERMLKYLGANINETTIYPSELTAKNIEIVGDISSAAFFIVAGLIVKDSDIVIKNVGVNPTRTGILDIVQRMGGEISIINEHEVSGEPCADIQVKYTNSLKGCTISGNDIPRLIDELPVIAVLASQAEDETIVKDAKDLRNKESDRISCLVKELETIGVDIEERPDGFVIRKSVLKGGEELECYHDHRLAMSFYIAGLVCEKEIAINGFEWTKISFPEFESLFSSLYN